MNVKLKYTFGQRVQAITLRYEHDPPRWYVPEEDSYNFVIQKIEIGMYNPKNKEYKDKNDCISYMANSPDYGYRFDEKDLFLSKEEAQIECNKRNKVNYEGKDK